ncbi:PLDc N-terminal domain-containing protein [Microbacterium sp. kSW2-24]|uniref:PLDc N-terminal domain-containing protein n=1 Tax=Microbacterium TaxID=33882 RepID=UPI001FFD8B5F|nr:PLDc N-terminal domain-containing protein [Microbacterium galbinum]MCK2023527.1 PLDc N-terminal domain-containing protein [Microbacterium galbinum]
MDANPLIPTAYDVILFALWVGAMVYTVVALVSAVRDRRVVGIRFLLWFLVIALVPVIGPTAWFVRRSREGEQARGAAAD